MIKSELKGSKDLPFYPGDECVLVSALFFFSFVWEENEIENTTC